MSKKNQQRATRPVVAVYTHEEVRLMRLACQAYAATLEVTDTLTPSIEIRDAVVILRDLADHLFTVNGARSYIEENPE